MTFSEHPLRERLQREFHARPPIPLAGPVLVSHLAFLHDGATAKNEREHLSQLCGEGVCAVVESSESHLVLDNVAFRVRWELHTEFSSYTFFRPLTTPGQAFAARCAIDDVPPEWLAAIPGQMITGTHIEVQPASALPTLDAVIQDMHEGRQVVVSQVADGAGMIVSDLHYLDGFTRFLLIDHGLTPRQAGRYVQRLWEIETYRMLALIGLPVAKEVGRWLRGAESGLAELMDQIGSAQGADDERAVLNQLSLLAAEVEHSVARTAFRFGATRAYHGLAMQRIEELRETRLRGHPTLRDFIERRLHPPMNTCLAMANRQEELSGRVARNSQLLRTRVDIELERQNQELLGQMNRRAKLQLRLQETVEGLSVVAITYYGSQIVQYLAKAGSKFAPAISPELATGFSIPVIATVVALGLRRMRKQLAAEEHEVASSGVH
jgi:uncharacterized membrane-anchored protein